MGFDKREAGKTYTRQEGDTLEAIAERETAAGNELTWEDLARFNWGTTDREQVNELLRDELGCRKRDDENNFVIATDDTGSGELVIPAPFSKTGLATDKTHTLRVKQKSCPEQFIECCKIPGVTFEFDKSFIRPSVVDHLKELDTMAAANPDAKIMVFGHTDKVGGEQYNKGLSERRAKSAYAFVVNDPDAWESLYNEENWGLKVVQQILKDLGHDPGPIDGVMGTQTKAAMKSFDASATSNNAAFRKKLFTAYMTTIHDVKIAPERFMKPKFMGCSEFNPIDDVETAHEPNRRVTFYLFHKDRLPKLPCEFTSLAPCHNQQSPRLPRHQESFSCSFYDSIAKKCNCEGPPVPAPATIEIIDAAGNVATAVRMGLWDNAFNAAGNVLNAVAEVNNFAGADTRRFHFRVNDPGAAGDSVNIEWKSLGSTRADLDSSGAQLTLVETAAGSKIFVSRGVLLTCDLHDVQQVTNSGLAAPLPDPGDRNRGQSNHRTRTGDMEGFVKGEYTPASGAAAVSVEAPVFERAPEERRRLPVQIFVLRVAAGGAGVVATAPGSALWTTDLRVMKETYERLGIKVETVVAPGTPAGDIVTHNGDSAVLINAPAGVNPASVAFSPTDDEATLGTAFPAVANTARVFVVGGLSSRNRGEAWPDVNFAARSQVGAAFVNGGTRGPYTLAHEVGHVLTNKSATVNGGHYNAPAGNRLTNKQNLLRFGTSTAEGVDQSKRLWDAADGDGLNQRTNIMASRFTRNF